MLAQKTTNNQVIADMELIDDFKRQQAAEAVFQAINPNKKKEEFRNYEDSARQIRVENFYKEQHRQQTVAFVEAMREKHLKLDKGLMGVWEAIEYLNTIVDDSDPDTNLTQLAHALQTAEAIRRDYPGEEYDWFHLVGLIHDVGKLLAVTDSSRNLAGDPQWAVVGDTFPVGCKFEETNIFHKYFDENPDSKNPKYNTALGMYKEGCGLSNVLFSWGHDEYLYQVCVRNNSKIPLEGLYMIRFHSFYPWHKHGGYQHLLNEQDKKMLEWVLKFNQYDLYSKADGFEVNDEMIAYYKRVISKYFPEKLNW